MGLWSWLFPSPEQRVEHARAHVDAGRWVDALDEISHLDRDDAREVIAEAHRGLVRSNLKAACEWGEAGDDGRVEHHMELAERWHQGGLEAELRDTRRTLREQRAERRARAEAERARLEEEQGMQAAMLRGPDGSIDEEAEEREARLALIVENYPPAIREGIEALGEDFGAAVLAFNDGHPDQALAKLLALPDSAPVVRWERARAAYALGDVAAGVRELRAFGELAKGHHPIGAEHSGVVLAQWTAETGDLHGALRVLRDLRTGDPQLGAVLFAQLLEATGELSEAEQVCRALIATAPKSDGLYLLLARIRLKGGHRDAAKSALEAAMSQVCCTPGKCGNKPPDVHVVRTLATLYLEDGSDVPRGLELAAQAQELRVQGGWEDAYLDALLARTQGSPDAAAAASHLLANTPDGHPGRARLTQYLGSHT